MKKSHPGVPPSEWYMNPSEGIQSSHVQGITVEALATALAVPAVQRAMADPVPTPAPVRESELVEPVPAGTPVNCNSHLQLKSRRRTLNPDPPM